MLQTDKEDRLRGFLNIEETEMSGSFCRRYFILDTANGKLSYYMHNPETLPESWKNPVGEIYLQHVNKVGDARKIRPKVQHCFVISVAGRQYFLQTEDDQSMENWMEALNSASKIVVPHAERQQRATEWHSVDLSQKGYVTEIVGGVVCKMPLKAPEDNDSSNEDEELRSTSGKISPSNLVPRQNVVHGRENETFETHKLTLPTIKAMKSGYAVKQGAVRKSWKRRFFVLHEQGLSYFKSEHEKHPIRTVFISDILEARQAEGASINRDNLFEILTGKRIFYVQCDSPTDMNSWIEAIRAAVKSRKLEERKSMQDAGGSQEQESEMEQTYPQEVWLQRRLARDGRLGRQKKKTWTLW